VAGPGKKKVVRVEHTAGKEPTEPTWKPTPQAKQQATTYRLIALVLWIAAIAIEGVAIFVVLKQHSVNMVLLIGSIVVIAVLSIIGSFLWKRANDADPASKSEPIRFFVQNQLGAIIAIIAFLPLIVMIFTNKNMAGQQKTVAGGIAIVALVVAGLAGVSWNPPSTEQYTTETNTVVQYTGHDLVYWTKDGSVYHLCQSASAVNQQSKDNTIYSGTVGDAHAAGKDRLTLQVESELKQCGLGTPLPAAPAS
jgi:hypothetical protein